jgi:cytochrome c oxidase cbb3-type subunit 4
MTYHDIAGWSQIVAMVIFGAVMAGVIVYALRPGNKTKFEAAARVPILNDGDKPRSASDKSPTLQDDDEEGKSNGRS